MEIRQLRYFLHVAEMQSLSRAAMLVRVAQPALSRQIKNLEEELGVPLLHRHGWGVTPTPAGQVLMDHARVVLKDMAAARDAVLAYQSEPSGHLSFGVPSSVSRMLLPELAVRFRRRAPKVRLHLVDGFSATIHDWLVQGRLDLAVLYETKVADGLVTTRLAQEEMSLVAPPGLLAGRDCVSLTEVTGFDLALPARPHRLRLLVDQALTDRGLTADPVLEVDALPALIDLVRRGGVCTVLPLSAVQDEVHCGQLEVAAITPAIRRSLILARTQSHTLTPAIDALEREVVGILGG